MFVKVAPFAAILIDHETHGYSQKFVLGANSKTKAENKEGVLSEGAVSPLTTSYGVWGSAVSSFSRVPDPNSFWTH